MEATDHLKGLCTLALDSCQVVIAYCQTTGRVTLFQCALELDPVPVVIAQMFDAVHWVAGGDSSVRISDQWLARESDSANKKWPVLSSLWPDDFRPGPGLGVDLFWCTNTTTTKEIDRQLAGIWLRRVQSSVIKPMKEYGIDITHTAVHKLLPAAVIWVDKSGRITIPSMPESSDPEVIALHEIICPPAPIRQEGHTGLVACYTRFDVAYTQDIEHREMPFHIEYDCDVSRPMRRLCYGARLMLRTFRIGNETATSKMLGLLPNDESTRMVIGYAHELIDPDRWLCDVCGIGGDGGATSTCTACKAGWYCGQMCQRQDWKSHAAFCKAHRI